MRESRVSPCLGMPSWGTLVVAGLLLCAGCGDGRIARYPVSGTVLVDSKPAEGAMVILCPASEVDELKNIRPMGRTDSSGKFVMTTFDIGDGAPAGDYKVLVQWPKGEEDLLKGRYFNLNATTLTAAVPEAPTELPPLQLTSQ